MRTKPARRARPANLSTRGIGTLPWSYFVVIAICGCIIAAGFLLAARQHFVSMDLGMKNSKLRKQLEDLESENRRLVLSREIASSPLELTRTARNFGFVEAGTAPAAVQVASTSPAREPSAPNASAISSALKITSAPTVAKTASVRPTAVVAAKLASKIEAVTPSPKKQPAAKGSKLDQNAVARR